MNILNIIHYPVFGGPHNRAAKIQRTLSKRGYESIVLVPSGQGNAEVPAKPIKKLSRKMKYFL